MEPNEFECKWIDKNEIWKIADEVRSTYWPEGILPVNVETIVEARLGLYPDPLHDLFSTTDMDAYLKMDLSGIVVDYDRYMNEKYANRIRFSFAHELGHYFLHKDLYSKINLISAQDWKYFIINIPEIEYRDFEWQANEFAGRLLVPRTELVSEVEKVVEIIKTKNLLGFLKDDSDAVLSRVSPALCKVFGVSTDVIEKRVKREGLWPPKL